MIERPIIAARAASSGMAVIAALLEQRTGQQITPERSWRLDASLRPLLRDLGLDSVDALVSALVTARDGALADKVVDALLNQETSFFRDAPVLDLIVDALDKMRGTSNRRLRIWSAGCSTGQEPLSLAILLDERGFDETAVEIVASDVSRGAIARANTAKFTQFEIQRGLSMHRMMKWFDSDGGDWTAHRDLSRRVAFRQHNLVSQAPPPGLFDMVLCRNVLLYLSTDLRRSTFDTLASAIRPDGALVLGAGETVIGQTDRFAPSKRWRGLYDLV